MLIGLEKTLLRSIQSRDLANLQAHVRIIFIEQNKIVVFGFWLKKVLFYFSQRQKANTEYHGHQGEQGKIVFR